ncbi:hypothetical protein ACO1O0_002475 [Amphichorda felina]
MSPTQLLDLPVECLQRILHETLPEGFEGASLSCKAMHAASTRFIEAHNRRRKRFRDFFWSKAQPEGRDKVDRTQPVPDAWWDEASRESGYIIPGPRRLLEAIADEPVLARYIHTIKMTGIASMYYYLPSRGDDNGYDSCGDYFWRLPQMPVSDRLRELVRASPDIAAVGGDPDVWIRAFDTRGDLDGLHHGEGDEPVPRWYESFLLTLLPNVTTLQLPNEWGNLSYEIWKDYWKEFEPILDRIVKRANDPLLPDAALSRLSVLLPQKGPDYEARDSLSDNCLLNGIQSLQELHYGGAVALNDGYTGIAFEPKYEEWSRNIEIVELDGVAIGSRELDHFLALANKGSSLRVFHLVYETKWHGCGFEWDSGACLAAIQRNCAESLEELLVTNIGFYNTDGQWTTLDDMTEFRQLKRIHLDVNILWGPAYDPEAPWGYESDEDEDFRSPAWPSLVNTLPKSIEKIHLHLQTLTSNSPKLIRKLFANLAAERSTKLPNLQEIVLFKSAAKHLDNKCQAAVDFAQSHGCRIAQYKEYSFSPCLKALDHRFDLDDY